MGFHGSSSDEWVPGAGVRSLYLHPRNGRENSDIFLLGQAEGPKNDTPLPLHGDPASQLYNLEEDLGEANNLYNQHPEVVARFKKALEEITTAKK
jgi:hypothetical protein